MSKTASDRGTPAGGTSTGRNDDERPITRSAGRSTQRRAALTATLVAVPIALVAWIGLFGWSGGFAGVGSPTASASPSTVAASGPVAVTLDPSPRALAPNTTASVIETYCRALLAKLPKQLGTQASRPILPASAVERAAAWGDPAIVLRCGVGAPAKAAGEDQVVTINGVDWRFRVGSDRTQIFQAINRKIAVEVDIPQVYTGKPVTLMGPLNDALIATVPPTG